MAAVRRGKVSMETTYGRRETGRTRQRVGLVLAMGLTLLWQSSLAADGPATPLPNPFKATTCHAARQSAIQSIPLDKLDPTARAKVTSVLTDVTMFRRLPIRVIQSDPDLYLFLVRHPDVIVNIWEVLGISQVAMQQIGPATFRMTEEGGFHGTVEYLYQNHDTHLIFIDGDSEGPLFTKRVRGRGLLILKTGYVREPDGRYYITNRLDALIRIQPGGAELLTKTFQPLVGKVADVNFTQTAGFLGSLSLTAQMNPRGMQRLAERLARVQPEIRRQFAQLSQGVALKAANLPGRQPSGQPRLATRPDPGQTR